MEETQRVPFDQTVRVCVCVFRGSKIQTITRSQDQHTAAVKCGNLAHGDDATGRQPLLAGPGSLLAAPQPASGKQARLRIFALLPSICVCVGMSCLLLWLETSQHLHPDQDQNKKKSSKINTRDPQREKARARLFWYKGRISAHGSQSRKKKRRPEIHRSWSAPLGSFSVGVNASLLMFHFGGSSFFYQLPTTTKVCASVNMGLLQFTKYTDT